MAPPQRSAPGLGASRVGVLEVVGRGHLPGAVRALVQGHQPRSAREPQHATVAPWGQERLVGARLVAGLAQPGPAESEHRDNVVAAIGGFATGKFTQPEEVADLAVYLASGRAANITGSNYLIDGGLIKTT